MFIAIGIIITFLGIILTSILLGIIIKRNGVVSKDFKIFGWISIIFSAFSIFFLIYFIREYDDKEFQAWFYTKQFNYYQDGFLCLKAIDKNEINEQKRKSCNKIIEDIMLNNGKKYIQELHKEILEG